MGVQGAENTGVAAYIAAAFRDRVRVVKRQRQGSGGRVAYLERESTCRVKLPSTHHCRSIEAKCVGVCLYQCLYFV